MVFVALLLLLAIKLQFIVGTWDNPCPSNPEVTYQIQLPLSCKLVTYVDDNETMRYIYCNEDTTLFPIRILFRATTRSLQKLKGYRLKIENVNEAFTESIDFRCSKLKKMKNTPTKGQLRQVNGTKCQNSKGFLIPKTTYEFSEEILDSPKLKAGSTLTLTGIIVSGHSQNCTIYVYYNILEHMSPDKE